MTWGGWQLGSGDDFGRSLKTLVLQEISPYNQSTPDAGWLEMLNMLIPYLEAELWNFQNSQVSPEPKFYKSVKTQVLLEIFTYNQSTPDTDSLEMSNMLIAYLEAELWNF